MIGRSCFSFKLLGSIARRPGLTPLHTFNFTSERKYYTKGQEKRDSRQIQQAAGNPSGTYPERMLRSWSVSPWECLTKGKESPPTRKVRHPYMDISARTLRMDPWSAFKNLFSLRLYNQSCLLTDWCFL